MTMDEALAHVRIRDTLARYNMAGDRLKVDDFLAVFTEDAVLEVLDRDGFRHEGRSAIAAWIGGFGARTVDSSRPAPQFVRHHLTTSQIDLVDADTATARTYFLVCTQIGPDHGGTYADRLRRVGERWLIAHRRVRTDWHADNGLFRPADGAGQVDAVPATIGQPHAHLPFVTD